MPHQMIGQQIRIQHDALETPLQNIRARSVNLCPVHRDGQATQARISAIAQGDGGVCRRVRQVPHGSRLNAKGLARRFQIALHRVLDLGHPGIGSRWKSR